MSFWMLLSACAPEPEPEEWYSGMSCQEVDDYLNLPIAADEHILITQVELDVDANAEKADSEINLTDCRSTNRDVVDPADTWWAVCGDWVAIAAMLTECEQKCSKPEPSSAFLECQAGCAETDCSQEPEPGECALVAYACERECPDYPVWDCATP